MPDTIEIKVKGLNELIAKFKRLPNEIKQATKAAGDESGRNVILPTQGLQKYPPETAANHPPTPFYIRGRGMQYKRGNDGRSERYGTQFYVRSTPQLVRIGNRASYAKWLTDGALQAAHMAAIGWRKLIDVAREKMPEITQVYEAWIERGLQKLRLKK